MRLLFKVFALGMLLGFFGATFGHAATPAAPITVEVRGSGPDVVLIPGLASSRAVWSDLAKTLEADHRVHLVQLDGFAGQPVRAAAQGPVVGPAVEAVAAYIAAAHLDHPAVIGHSLGGYSALLLARTHPEAVGRLMVVDALPFFSVLIDPAATAQSIAPRAAAARDAMLAQSPDAFAAGQTRTLTMLVKSPDGRKQALEWSLASDRKVLAQAMYDVMTGDLRPDLPAIKAPTTVVYAYDADLGLPQPNVDGLYAASYAGLPDKTLVRVDGARHFVMLDQPAAFAKAVQAFLAR